MKNVPTYLEYIHRQRIIRATGLLTYKQAFINSYKFAEFNEEEPQLCHFIRCDKDNKPLEKPGDLEDFRQDTGLEFHEWNEAKMDFQEAAERVRWKGFESVVEWEEVTTVNTKNGDCGIGFYKDGGAYIGETKKPIKTYGDIITSNIPLECTEQQAIDLKLK